MDVTSIIVPNGNSVYLLDNYFPEDILSSLTDICNGFSESSEQWERTEWTDKRYIFKNISQFNPILDNFIKTVFAPRMMQALHHTLTYESSTLWVDLPGLGKLQPHKEGPGGGTYLMQVYLTNKSEPFNGTTIYTDDKQVLFQLPYRNNFGWLLDQATGVMHGRHSDVSPNLKRFSIMIRFI